MIKNKSFMIRMSDQEKKDLEKAARKKNFESASAYVRDLIRKDK